LRGTLNCSDQISGEHYISAAVLAQFGEVIRVSGAHWLEEGESRETTIGNLKANILCRRHNEALSPLDAEAGLFFAAILNVLKGLQRKTLSRKPNFRLISGEMLELWMLKVACGLYFGIGSAERKRISDDHTIDLGKVERAFFLGKWDARGGLYMQAAPGDAIRVSGAVGIAPITDQKEKFMAGATMTMLGLKFDLLFDTRTVNPGPWTALAKAPTELVWRRKDRQYSIILTWPIGTPERSVIMESRDR
jgi:hypothetical protein